MIELSQDVEIPEAALATEKMERPMPDAEPPSVEMDEIPEGFDKAVFFSGGDDSLVLTHFVMSRGWADFVAYFDTTSGIAENLQYVRDTCEKYGWPLVVVQSPMPLETFAMRYGFCGPSGHKWAFNYFKGRQIRHIAKQTDHSVKFFSGVRKDESDRRLRNVSAEVQYEDNSTGNFEGWWVSPLMDWTDEEVDEYRERYDLPDNPVARRIHRSGDCYCLAYGHRDEELLFLEAEFPRHAQWIKNVETRVMEYRGRVEVMRERYPEIQDELKEIRESQLPYPMRLTVLRDHFPEAFEEIAAVPFEEAYYRGRADETNYIGHGGMSDEELQQKMEDADVGDATLCETCVDDPSDSLAPSVGAMQAEARQKLEAL